ncbi:cation transporter [Rubrivirga sp. S365]|uniref:heavy-metal-associated domain-containing protein n=1 Tax=Rubrivirga sp. S365 TaxID=3076080 RepID=UPI0028C51C1B|nr:cation transporter [Rubrivirga sp. S365]MDT7856804.1 cation transporter [Rubrivirga sp. S365]
MSAPPRSHTEELTIDGMSCDHCVAAVRNALESVPGADVRDVEVSRAVVEAAPDTTRAMLVAAVERAGYGVASAR